MEVSVIGSCKVNIFKTYLVYRDVGFCSFKSSSSSSNNNGALLRKSGAFFGHSSRYEFGRNLSLKAVHSESIKPSSVSSSSSSSRSQSHVGAKLYVGLPLDAVSDSNTVNHAKAIAAGLKALKLLGVEGVELPVWWGIAEKEAMGKYNWSGYLALVEMIQKVGLKVHVSLCFHASKESKIPLPEWVTRVGEQEPSIYFADRSGQQYKECLSLAVDDLPVLEGKTPVQIYRDFCESFKNQFSPYIGTTINGISVGLGPDGELRYPSHRGLSKSKVPGAGEFQCYDKNMLILLKEHAEANGNPNWGLSGPHDAPNYNGLPTSNGFVKDHGGSWESPYGNFFLSWYSSQLASHADRLLSLANATFSDHELPIYGRIPLVHSWYKTRSHASELTAGYYNTESKDGYETIADIFARNSCRMILPGMDLSDEQEPQGSHSSPELLLGQVSAACSRHGVEISGQNSSVTGVAGGFEQIKKYLSGENNIGLFIYQRMGAYFFSPEHFPSFTQFVRSISQKELQSDDLLGEEAAEESVTVTSESGIQMQAA